MTPSIEGFVESEESFLTLRGVTEVFFQLTVLTSDRVELGESDAVIQLSLTCSSMKGIVLIPPRLRLDIRVLEPGHMPSTT